jgi:hypothetical protein
MSKLFSKHILISASILFVSLLLIGVFAQRAQHANNAERIDAYSEPKKQLEHVQILETLDMNSGEPRFKLHVQTHVGTTIKPNKLVLFNKTTKQKVEEHVLTMSEYPNECVSHQDMLDTMVKWDTQWFTLPALGNVDNLYTSQLTDKYSVLVLYQDGSLQEVEQSSHVIDGVCYQVQKTVPEIPLIEREQED